MNLLQLLVQTVLVLAASVGFAETFDLELAAGWNLVSIPLSPSNPAPEAVFPPPQVAAVFEYDAVAGYVVPVAIQPKKGYWVRAASAITLSIAGQRPWDTSIALAPGWNLIGVVGPSAQEGAQPVPPETDVSAIWSCGPPWVRPRERCREGRGYWVRVSRAMTIWPRPVIHIDAVQVVAPANPQRVPKYEKVELLVVLSNVAATHLYEPDPARGGLHLVATFSDPDGNLWRQPGFYDGASWRIRFAPDRLGEWQYAVTATDPSGQSNTATGAFTCAASPHRGWARIDGTVLRLSEGSVLFPVGHNTGWQYDVEQPPLADMAARGENLLTFWLAVPWARPSWTSPEEPWWAARAPIENLEDGLGNYNQVACAYLDGVVARAEAAGVYLLPTIWSHGQLRDDNHPWGPGWWSNNAYSSVCTAADFFATSDAGGETPQWHAQKNFYRYLIARWGYSRAIAGWVGICEMDGTTGYYRNPAQATAWCTAVRDWFRANDPFRRNAAGALPLAGFKVDAPTWDPGFDLRATDSYQQRGSDTGVAALLAAQTATMRASGKPCFHGEFGGDVLNGATQPAHLHNGIWAGAATGAAIAPLVWCDGGNYPMLNPAMRDHLEYLSQFMAGIGYLGNPALTPLALSVTGACCRGWGMGLSDRGYGWLQNTAGTMGGQTLTLSGVSPGNYRLRWYNVWASGAVPVATVSPIVVGGDGKLTVPVPSVAVADIAFQFEPD